MCFNFRSHISAICSSCIYDIRDLWCIRRHLDLDSAKWLANALVSSCLDYCNSLLSGIAETDLTKLQRVLNRLKALDEQNIEIRTSLRNIIYNSGMIPTEMKHCIYVCVVNKHLKIQFF